MKSAVRPLCKDGSELPLPTNEREHGNLVGVANWLGSTTTDWGSEAKHNVNVALNSKRYSSAWPYKNFGNRPPRGNENMNLWYRNGQWKSGAPNDSKVHVICQRSPQPFPGESKDLTENFIYHLTHN